SLADAVRLYRSAAERALGSLDAAHVVRAVDAEMIRGLQRVPLERGHDPADVALLACRGAAPLHGCQPAAETGLRTRLVPAPGGVRTAEVRAGPPLELPAAEPLRVEGPALVELDGATCWVTPGWVGVRDGTPSGGSSTLTLTRG